nr:MAG TPA: hypothetical protein [Caudoviricetes sp.]
MRPAHPHHAARFTKRAAHIVKKLTNTSSNNTLCISCAHVFIVHKRRSPNFRTLKC